MNSEIQFFHGMLFLTNWSLIICGVLLLATGRFARGAALLFVSGYLWAIVWLGEIGLYIHLAVMVALAIAVCRANSAGIPQATQFDTDVSQ